MNQSLEKWIANKVKAGVSKFLEKECDRLMTVLTGVLPDKELIAVCDIEITQLNVQYSGTGLVKLVVWPDVFRMDYQHRLERRIQTGPGGVAPEVFAILPRGALQFTVNGEGALDEINLKKIIMRQGVRICRADFHYKITVDLKYAPRSQEQAGSELPPEER